MNVVASVEVSLARVFTGQEQLCDVLDRCLDVSRFLLERAPRGWAATDAPAGRTDALRTCSHVETMTSLRHAAVAVRLRGHIP